MNAVQTSPSTAARSIISSYAQSPSQSTETTAKKPTARIRLQRRFGENITDGTLLYELKEKAAVKEAKQAKKDAKEKSRRPLTENR